MGKVRSSPLARRCSCQDSNPPRQSNPRQRTPAHGPRSSAANRRPKIIAASLLFKAAQKQALPDEPDEHEDPTEDPDDDPGIDPDGDFNIGPDFDRNSPDIGIPAPDTKLPGPEGSNPRATVRRETAQLCDCSLDTPNTKTHSLTLGAGPRPGSRERHSQTAGHQGVCGGFLLLKSW